MATPTAAPSQNAHDWFDILLAASMVVLAVAFLGYLQLRTGTGRLGSYELTGRIADAAGLDVGSDVRIGGVKVGSISALELDQKRHLAVVHMALRDDLTIPADSRLTVTAPVVGSLYLTILPGHAKSALPEGGSFTLPARPSAPKPAPSS